MFDWKIGLKGQRDKLCKADKIMNKREINSVQRLISFSCNQLVGLIQPPPSKKYTLFISIIICNSCLGYWKLENPLLYTLLNPKYQDYMFYSLIELS